jgi:hypothetical protein
VSIFGGQTKKLSGNGTKLVILQQRVEKPAAVQQLLTGNQMED